MKPPFGDPRLQGAYSFDTWPGSKRHIAATANCTFAPSNLSQAHAATIFKPPGPACQRVLLITP